MAIRVVLAALAVFGLAACDSGTSVPTTPSTAAAASTADGFGPAAATLPLRGPVGDARQVVTVVVPSATATRGRITLWNRLADGRWQRDAPPTVAYVGRLGVRRAPRESQPYSPIGTFPITEGFGRLAVDGVRLPYRRTGPDDWWISQPGPLYNTFRHCRIGCPFRQGPPNAPLASVRPQYDYAVVIDYNRRPVRQGAGSGFFLHVAKGRPTNGCVSTPAGEMVDLLRWLDPARRPRLMIGVGQP